MVGSASYRMRLLYDYDWLGALITEEEEFLWRYTRRLMRKEEQDERRYAAP